MANDVQIKITMKRLARLRLLAVVLLLHLVVAILQVDMSGQGPPPCSSIQCNNNEDPGSSDEPNQQGSDSGRSCSLASDELSNVCFQRIYIEIVGFLLQNFCLAGVETETVAEDLQRIIVLCQNACMPSMGVQQQGRLILDADWNGYLICESLKPSESQHISQVDGLISQYLINEDAEGLRPLLDSLTSLIHGDSEEDLRLAIDSFCIEPKAEATSEPLQLLLGHLVSHLCSIASGNQRTNIEGFLRYLALQETEALIELSDSDELEILNLLGLTTRTASGCWTHASADGCGQPQAEDSINEPTAIRILQSIFGCLIGSGHMLIQSSDDSSYVFLGSGAASLQSRGHKGVIDILSTSDNRKKACLIGAIATLAYNESDLDFARR